MTDYRELLRLRSLGLNHSQIALSAGVARQTVITTLARAIAIGMDWRTAEGLSNKELAAVLFPPSKSKTVFKMPEYAEVADRWLFASYYRGSAKTLYAGSRLSEAAFGSADVTIIVDIAINRIGKIDLYQLSVFLQYV